MTTTEILLQKLMEMEGLRLEAYEDAAGVPTIGYGHTKNVRMGDKISEYWAREMLREDIEEAEWQVKELGEWGVDAADQEGVQAVGVRRWKAVAWTGEATRMGSKEVL